MAALTALAHADIYPTGDFRLKSNSVSNCRKKLTDAHSVPDAVAAYQEWVNDEMGARAEDARLLMSNGQKFMDTTSRFLSSGGTNVGMTT